MRCPKCHYLSFDPEPRCKNCGYDLAVEGGEDIEVESNDSELTLHVVDREPVPLPEHDLPLRSPVPAARPVTLELVRPAPEPVLVGVGAPTPTAAPAPAPRRAAVARAPHTTTELPLFVKAITVMEPERTVEDPATPRVPSYDPLPLVTAEPLPAPTVQAAVETEEADLTEVELPVPPAPRPLSVRRPVPEPVKTAPRVERRVGPIDRDLIDDLRRLDREAAQGAPIHSQRSPREGSGDEPVTFSERLSAAALDGLLLGGIGAFVLWMTLKLTNASPSDLTSSAIVAMGAFLAGVSIAYLLMFTAADGQTLGKMLMGLRVVGEGGYEHVTVSQAARRAILAPLSVGALGLGWLPALFGRGIALHDRFAHTRVVRA